MAASRSAGAAGGDPGARVPPQSGRAKTAGHPSSVDTFRLGYLGAGLLAVWILQSVIGPLLSQGAEIPYSEFKTKLAAGQALMSPSGPPLTAS